MGKRITYYDKIERLVREARQETIDVMKSHDVSDIDLSDRMIYVYEMGEGENCYHRRLVKSVNINNYGMGDVLEFEAEGESIYYFNPLLWVQIHEAVLVALGEFDKRYKWKKW